MKFDTEHKFALLRIAFGFVWAVDAYFKWLPEVRYHIVDVLTQAQVGQPMWEQVWIGWWAHLASLDPTLFGTGIAVIETMLALSLITGVFSRAAKYCGVLFALMIWSVPQGFGGPYAPGTTDIDSGIIYVFLFIALIVGHAWRRYNVLNLFKK